MSVEKFTIEDLKLAYVNNDFEQLKKLSQKEPEIYSIEEAIELQKLINEILETLNKQKKTLLKEMNKIKKIKEFQSKKDYKCFDFKG